MNAKLVIKNLILTAIGGSFALTALAQWQWTDKDGHKVFSDRSPPAEIQDKNILKRPGNHQMAAVPASQSSAASLGTAASAAAGKASAPKLSGKDAQLEARKKQAEEEDAAKKKVEEEKIAMARADNCERARKGLASFQSGVRIAVTNAKGEREIMDDSARALEMKRLQGIVDSDCK
ncbi:MAG TPA: DUF4124 domain-containing protein [Polaromonas sp.]|nr:DUF4124 domain-containing protein [Polaromonas sp.]